MAELTSEQGTTPNGKNTCGVLGLIFSIVGFCLCGTWLFTIPGIILSLIGLRKEPRKAATAGAIIGGIGFLIFPLMVAILLPAVSNARHTARIMQSNYKIHSIQSGSEQYHAEHNAYPTSMDQLQDGGYINADDRNDAWDNPYRFEGGGKTAPVITSAGKDGEFGTDDDVYKKDLN